MTGSESVGFLPNLTKSFVDLTKNGGRLSTKDFAEACGKVVLVFDHIGTVFQIAKSEFSGKRETLVKVADQYPHLDDVVAAGKKDGSIVKKNSPSRNLHRLLTSVSFISYIFENLSQGKELREAVTDAYDKTLALIHTWVVRAGIKTGMLGLPSTETFFSSIGETHESAREHAKGFMEAANVIVGQISKLYEGVEIPRSDFSIASLWATATA